jgi:hypothetical protein
MACEQGEHPISYLGLPKRAVNAFARGGVYTLKEAAEWSDDALLSLPHVGHAFVAALRAAQHRQRKH